MEISTSDILLMSTDIFEIYIQKMKDTINTHITSGCVKDEQIAYYLGQILIANTEIWKIRNTYPNEKTFIQE